MKTMYLHIGTPKTATTAIQSFCNDNQEVLQSKGYAYPMFPYKYAGVAHVRNGHFMIDGVYGNDHKEREAQAEIVFEEGFNKLYELFEKYDNIILSDEGMWNHSFLKKGLFWERMKREMDKGIFQLKIVVYLRRQDDYLFSWWNQQVKAGGVAVATCDWNELVEKKPAIKLDYYGMLKQIEEQVGEGNIIVRVFDKNNLYGGSIFADFLNAVGLEFTDEFVLKKAFPNPSLNKNDVEVKRMINMMPGITGPVNSFFRKAVTKHSEVYKDDNSISMFSKSEYNAFMKNYTEGNDKIAKEYLDKKHLFDTTYTAKGKWQEDSVELMQSMASIMGEMMTYVMEENMNLKKEIKSLKERVEKLEQ